jgi:hypothetical protein
MAITKCLIWLRPVTGVTVATRPLRQCGGTDGWSALLGWREIMSKTTLRNVKAGELKDELQDGELGQISGGLVVYSIIGILVGRLETR